VSTFGAPCCGRGAELNNRTPDKGQSTQGTGGATGMGEVKHGISGGWGGGGHFTTKCPPLGSVFVVVHVGHVGRPASATLAAFVTLCGRWACVTGPGVNAGGG